MQCLTRCAAALAVVAAALVAALAAGAWHVTGWLNDPDTPERAGAILVLGGDPSRALEAAELYRGALAPAVYIVAPFREPSLRRLDGAGVPSPREEELTRKALTARGVPESAIALLGSDVMSTAQEARLAAERLAGVPGTLIVVTSPYHIRRARLIFREALPGRPLRFVGSRYEPLPDAWWTDRVSARNVVLELAKTAYYAVGGRF